MTPTETMRPGHAGERQGQPDRRAQVRDERVDRHRREDQADDHDDAEQPVEDEHVERDEREADDRRPRCRPRSWSVPSDGDTLWVVSSLSWTGSAPYCRTVARSFASPSLKSPEICTSPSKLSVWNAGRGLHDAVEHDRDRVLRRLLRERLRGELVERGRAVVLQRAGRRSSPACPPYELRLRAAHTLPGQRGGAELVADRRLVIGLAARAGRRSRSPCPRPASRS